MIQLVMKQQLIETFIHELSTLSNVLVADGQNESNENFTI